MSYCQLVSALASGQEAVRTENDGPAGSMGARALVQSHIAAIMLANDDQRARLIGSGRRYVPRLEAFPSYPNGMASLAHFYELAGDKETAATYFERCGIPDLPAAVFSRDREIRQRWIKLSSRQNATTTSCRQDNVCS